MSNWANHPLKHWLPYRLVEDKDGEHFFEWIYLNDNRFTDPFFEDTLAKCKWHPTFSSGYTVRTSPSVLVDWASQVANSPLQALIFHVSRCGSTLLSQLLSIPAKHIVISEAPLIDQLLSSMLFDPMEKATLLQAVFIFYGQKRFEGEQGLFIKLDAWHLLRILAFRHYLPTLPFLILYRDPVQVLASHQLHRGMHMIPHLLPPALFGFTEEELAQYTLDDYGVHVLEKYFIAILDFSQTDINTQLLHYNEGMDFLFAKLVQALQLTLSEEEKEAMGYRLQHHSKRPDEKFAGDKGVTTLQPNLQVLLKKYEALVYFEQMQTNAHS